MGNVNIKFNNKEFILSCEDGQEEHLEELLIQISQKFNNLKDDLGNELTDEALAIQVAIVTFLNSYLLKGSINDVSSIQEACNLIGCIIAGRATGTRASNGVANTLAQFTSKFRVFIDSGGQGTEFNSDQGPDLNYIGGVNGGGAS